MEPKKKKISAKLLTPWLLFLAALVVIAFLLLSQKNFSASKPVKNDFTDTINSVGQLLVLPAGETPTIATVANLDQIKNQPFFANAKVGDKVLIYSKSQKAILYDPSINKIIEIAPLDLGNIQNSTSSQ